MNNENSRDSFWSLLLLAGAFLILLIFGLRTISGSDIWFHLAAGRHALAHGPASIDPFSFGQPDGTPWRQTTWLYDILVFKAWTIGGSTFTIFLHIAAVLGAFGLLVPVCRRHGRDTQVAAAFWISAWIMAPLFTPRPALFALPLLAVALRTLSQPRLSRAGVAILLVNQTLWANMHLSFGLGIILAGLTAWEAHAARREPSDPPRTSPGPYLLLMLGLVAASCVNPFTTGLFKEVWAALTRPEGSVQLEWISLFFREFLPPRTAAVNTVALVLLACVFIFRRERLPVLPTALAVLSAYLMVRSYQAMDFCAVMIAPFLTMALALGPRLLERRVALSARAGIQSAAALLFALVMLFSAFYVLTNRYYIHIGSASAFGFGVTPDAYPGNLVGPTAPARALPARTLNIAHDGGFLLCHRPGEKVFSDPRGSWYGGPFFERLAKGLRGNKDHWAALLKQFDPEGVLINMTWSGAGDVVAHLYRNEQWAMAYFDGNSVLMVRKISANSAWMNDHPNQRRGLEKIEASLQRYRKRLESDWERPSVPPRLIGAATTYQSLGRYDEALKILKELNRGAPRFAAAWVNRGLAEYQLKQYDDAIASLEYAVSMLPERSAVWLWLSKAYRAAGHDQQADQAASRVRGVSPERLDTLELDELFPDAPTTDLPAK